MATGAERAHMCNFPIICFKGRMNKQGHGKRILPGKLWRIIMGLALFSLHFE